MFLYSLTSIDGFRTYFLHHSMEINDVLGDGFPTRREYGYVDPNCDLVISVDNIFLKIRNAEIVKQKEVYHIGDLIGKTVRVV